VRSTTTRSDSGPRVPPAAGVPLTRLAR
jgi:hypothetical protein